MSPCSLLMSPFRTLRTAKISNCCLGMSISTQNASHHTAKKQPFYISDRGWVLGTFALLTNTSTSHDGNRWLVDVSAMADKLIIVSFGAKCLTNKVMMKQQSKDSINIADQSGWLGSWCSVFSDKVLANSLHLCPYSVVRWGAQNLWSSLSKLFLNFVFLVRICVRASVKSFDPSILHANIAHFLLFIRHASGLRRP